MDGVFDSSRQFRTLDGLRGMAALWIAVLHIPHFLGGWHLPGSFLAVDLFFVLSGFVLANAYERRFDAGMGFVAFMRVRIIRLYPLYLLSCLLGLAVALLALRHGGVSVGWNMQLLLATIPLSALMLPTPRLGPADVLFPLNPVLWSIFLEVVVNAVYVLAYPLLRRTAVVAGVVATAGVLLVIETLRFGNLDAGFSWNSLPVGLARLVYSFFLGVLMFRIFDQRRRRESDLALVLVLALPLIFWLSGSIGVQLVAATVLLPLIVWVGLHVEPRRGALLFNAGGVSSYALYALHKPVYQITLGGLIIVLPFRPEALVPWLGILFLPVLIGATLLVDRFYDAPVRRWLSDRVKRSAGDAWQAPTRGTGG